MGRVRACPHRRRGSEFALIREIGSDFSVKSHQRKNVTLCGVFSLVGSRMRTEPRKAVREANEMSGNREQSDRLPLGITKSGVLGVKRLQYHLACDAT